MFYIFTKKIALFDQEQHLLGKTVYQDLKTKKIYNEN